MAERVGNLRRYKGRLFRQRGRLAPCDPCCNLACCAEGLPTAFLLSGHVRSENPLGTVIAEGDFAELVVFNARLDADTCNYSSDEPISPGGFASATRLDLTSYKIEGICQWLISWAYGFYDGPAIKLGANPIGNYADPPGWFFNGQYDFYSNLVIS